MCLIGSVPEGWRKSAIIVLAVGVVIGDDSEKGGTRMLICFRWWCARVWGLSLKIICPHNLDESDPDSSNKVNGWEGEYVMWDREVIWAIL